ncbi:MAG: tetratricopeptide repeat-containing sensor histidine kinase [Bacteroidota bacterium]
MAFLKVRILIVTCMLMLATASAFAQAHVGPERLAAIADLEAKLKATSDDSVKSRILIDLSYEYQYVNHAKSLSNAEQALKLALDNDYKHDAFEAYGQLALLASLSGDYATALKLDNTNLTRVVEEKDSVSISAVLNYLGNDYHDLGQYDEAYRYFTQSNKIASIVHDSLRMLKSTHNIGTVFKELGQYDVALQHYDLARKIGEAIRDQDGVAYMLDEKGDVALRQGDYEKAKELLLEAMRVIKERNLPIVEHKTLTKLALVSTELKDYDMALMYYDSANTIHKKHDNEFGVAEATLGKSKVYLEKGQFKEAEALLLTASESARQLNARKLETESYRLLSELAEKKGDFKNALRYYKIHKSTEDSIISAEMLQNLYKSQLRFATETKDSEIALLTKSAQEQAILIKRKEFLFNILAVVVALCAVLLFSIYRSGQRRIRINKLLMEHQAEIKKRSVELEQLNQVKDKFFSIISHDLRSPMNALSGILDLAEKKQLQPEEFTQVTKELRIQFNHTKTLINNLLDWTLLQMDKLNIHEDKVDLHAMVDENFKLFAATQTKSLMMKNLVTPGAAAIADMNMVNLVFRNLILNAIKFTEVGGIVSVSAKPVADGFIQVGISDSGVGIAPEVQKILFEKTTGYSTRGTANEKGTGLGLILCKEFVERMGGKIWLESEPGKGSTFYFTLKKA